MKSSDISEEDRPAIAALLEKYRDDAHEMLRHFDREFGRFLLLANGGAAAAGLGYLSAFADHPAGHVVAAVGLFALGLILAGSSTMTAIIVWARIHLQLTQKVLDLYGGSLTFEGVRQPPSVPRLLSWLEHWMQRGSFLAFIAGLCAGLMPQLYAYLANVPS